MLHTPPVAVSWAPNRIDLFAQGTDSALWYVLIALPAYNMTAKSKLVGIAGGTVPGGADGSPLEA